MPPGVLVNDSPTNSADDIQIALAPHIQSYLSITGRRRSCCSVMLPVAFERAAAQSWMDPKFDSPVLEGQFKTSVFPHIRMRYRFTLCYILLCLTTWFLYFVIDGDSENYWSQISCSLAILMLMTVMTLCFTHGNMYRSHTISTSAITAITICGASLTFLGCTGSAFSPLGHFAICLEIILIIYTALPMKLWLSTLIAISYSILFEILTHLVGNTAIHGRASGFSYEILILRILLQCCGHLVGMHVLVMNVVRMRGTFMKVGQNLLVRRQLEMEKQLKEKMIHSVMPPRVADLLLNEVGIDSDGTGNVDKSSCYMGPRVSNDVKSLFRPFHMHSMENVSILFADIVGFTKMSSTKTAEQLVEILNDLFERFDELCTINGCEKISTLGDCYYCVSGCPEPRPDHAICCVEMGLGMIDTMQEFDSQGIKMRVGVHTGTVLCGIVGTRRVKFDVWSNDVTLANKMESSGKPKQVHISEETSKFLDDAYVLEDGEEIFGHRTYFVVGRRKDTSSGSCSNNFLQPDVSQQNSSQTSQSTTNLSDIHPKVPPASPIGQSNSLNPSPLLSIRPRLTSLSMKVRKKSQSRDDDPMNIQNEQPSIIAPSRQHPKIVITTKSLPGSLESDDQEEEQEGCCRGSNVAPKPRSNPDDETKSKLKLRNWKIPRFLKKIEDGRKSSSTDASTALRTLKYSKGSNSANGKSSEEVVLQVEQNGYQQLPVLIEIAKPSWHKLDIPHKSINISPNCIKSPDGSCCSPGQHSMFDDVIDIRSYISQSRSDISPFGRSGSYRSQCGRSGQSDASPNGRARASTLVVDRTEATVPPATITQSRNIIWPDGLSICPSATSRKDSGIKSNSRRSSIQQQIFALNQSTISQHRVSGYFTSSTSSISNIVDAHQRLPQIPPIDLNAQALNDPLAACLQQLRKQSDLQLIRCVRDNAKSQRSYLVKPPLQRFSLFFMSRQMERDFRSKAHRFGNEIEAEGPPTLATPRYNTYIDIFIGIAVYLCISGSLFLMTPSISTPPFRLWVSIFAVFTAIQIFALFLFTRQMVRRHSSRSKVEIAQTLSFADRIFEAISSWYPWHICLAILMAMPVILIMVNFLLLDLNQLQAFEYHYGFLIFVCIVHFCNFTQLNCWIRNILAFLAALCFVGIAVSQLTVYSNRFDSSAALIITTNSTNPSGTIPQQKITKFIYEEIKWFQDYHLEIYLDLLLILVLVWFLNREFEIGYRLTFYGNAVANQDKIRVQNMKNQADMLLHNIIPKHVAEHLKNTAKYSENHHDIGIIFASIVNFNEMYDESYLGGKEYLRVLNELIGDFDELLSRSEFRCVEKIKTIGSTFMAASGLDPSSRGEDNEHIVALIEFSMAMQSVVEAFNKDLLEFNLVLRIGLNVGDVTAGVIGTSKLHYDIWGDAVNVASRMDSTGVPNRIQVGKDCLRYLESKYDFEPRGKVYVKGKDNMEVFLLVGRKETDNNENGEDTKIAIH